MQEFQGAWPAMVTPFTHDNRVDVSQINALVDYLLGKKVDGLYLCGSTGQGVYQSVAERKLVTETALKRIDGKVPSIVHVGCQVLGDAIELAVHAQERGAAGISSIIPDGYTDLGSIGKYYASVARATPQLPFLPYLFTSSRDAVALMEAIGDIPNLAGSKYTGPNMYEFKNVVDARHRPWSVFSGMDEQCVFAAMFGACGNIGSTLNVMPGVYREIHKSYRNGDLLLARDLQARANRVTQTMISFGFMGALYAALPMLGIDCGSPRLPARPLSREETEALKTALEAVDFYKLAEM